MSFFFITLFSLSFSWESSASKRSQMETEALCLWAHRYTTDGRVNVPPLCLPHTQTAPSPTWEDQPLAGAWWSRLCAYWAWECLFKNNIWIEAPQKPHISIFTGDFCLLQTRLRNHSVYLLSENKQAAKEHARDHHRTNHLLAFPTPWALCWAHEVSVEYSICEMSKLTMPILQMRDQCKKNTGPLTTAAWGGG